MAALDWVFIAVLAVSLLIGAWRGLVFELLSLVGWAVAFIAAQWFAGAVGAWLPVGAPEAPWRPVAGFAVVFIGAVFAFGLVGRVVKQLIDAVGLRPADRALGALFGVLRGAVLLLVATLAVGWTHSTDAPWWRQSQGAPLLEAAVAALVPALPDALGQRLPGGAGPPLRTMD